MFWVFLKKAPELPPCCKPICTMQLPRFHLATESPLIGSCPQKILCQKLKPPMFGMINPKTKILHLYDFVWFCIGWATTNNHQVDSRSWIEDCRRSPVALPMCCKGCRCSDRLRHHQSPLGSDPMILKQRDCHAEKLPRCDGNSDFLNKV